MTDSIEITGMARASIPNPTSTPASPSARTGWSSTTAIDISVPWLIGSAEGEAEVATPRAVPQVVPSRIAHRPLALGLSAKVVVRRS